MGTVLVICSTSLKLEAIIGTNILVLLSLDWLQGFNQPKDWALSILQHSLDERRIMHEKKRIELFILSALLVLLYRLGNMNTHFNALANCLMVDKFPLMHFMH